MSRKSFLLENKNINIGYLNFNRREQVTRVYLSNKNSSPSSSDDSGLSNKF